MESVCSFGACATEGDTLHAGDKGPYVKQVQQRLSALGYWNGFGVFVASGSAVSVATAFGAALLAASMAGVMVLYIIIAISTMSPNQE